MAEKGKAGKTKGPAQAASKKVGEAVDLLDKMRDRRKALAAKVEEMKREEDAMEDQIFAQFSKQELEGARGRRAQASIGRHDYPTAEDWEKTDAYIIKTKSLDLLQRRLSVEAVRERWKDGVDVPGVGKFTKVTLHLSKIKDKSAAAPAKGKR